MDDHRARAPSAGTPPQPTPGVRLRLDDGRTVWGLSLPVVEHLATRDEPRVLGHLGPDLLHEPFDASEAARRLHAAADTTIRTTLLDQRVVAGLGNLG